MSNSIYNDLKPKNNSQNNDDAETRFNTFMQCLKGQNPNQILNNLVSSGKVSQQQLNQAYKQAENYKNQFEGMRKKFGL